ncbi:hypothetical protein EsH8_IV_000571 [Colletotrichum jinshuiense]
MQPLMVPPGLETGIFYIPIANLPFDANWRQLKDWLREGCAVDRVQIFAPSTSGWVRVRGQHNFYGACDRLKDGVFHGRRIMFDDRNMTNPIMVKGVDLNESPVPVPSRARGPDVGTASYQQTGLYPHDSFSEPSYAQWDPGSRSLQQGDITTRQQTVCYPDDGVSSGGFPGASGQVVTTEHRRIIVKRIGHNASDDQIKDLIRQSLEIITPVKAELQRIDVPRGSNNQTRGHAFATFRTSETAQRVAETLNGKTWNARKIEARMVNEESADEHPRDLGSRRRKSSDPPKKRRAVDRVKVPSATGSNNRPTGESLSSRQPQRQQKTGPVVVDGSNRRSRSESKERKPR